MTADPAAGDDVGFEASFNVTVSGGFGSCVVTWSGLPTGATPRMRRGSRARRPPPGRRTSACRSAMRTVRWWIRARWPTWCFRSSRLRSGRIGAPSTSARGSPSRPTSRVGPGVRLRLVPALGLLGSRTHGRLPTDARGESDRIPQRLRLGRSVVRARPGASSRSTGPWARIWRPPSSRRTSGSRSTSRST